MAVNQDDITLLATLAENPSLAKEADFEEFIGRLNPSSRKLARAIVKQSSAKAAGSSAKAAGKKKGTAGDDTDKTARSILQWARENRRPRR